MRIVADENIPYAGEAFASLGEVTTLAGRSLQSQHLCNCDILLVRSVTQVNAKLLDNTPVKFVASATIGTDHVDLDYLSQRHIGFANAPGCNAEAAAEYVINVLMYLASQNNFDPFRLTAGIIGHGNVGSRVEQKLKALGIRCLLNDPPKQQAPGDSDQYVSLETILEQCDFITLHVPLTRTGPFPTLHLIDEDELRLLAPNCLLFNAARGSVVNNSALLKVMENRRDLCVFLDTWENEPNIDLDLLQRVDFGSPHIAGYSVEGKLRGTQMILEAVSETFKKPVQWSMQQHLPNIFPLNLSFQNGSAQSLHQLLQAHYPVQQDHESLLKNLLGRVSTTAQAFDLLRKNYPDRYEYERFSVRTDGLDPGTRETLEKLSFGLA